MSQVVEPCLCRQGDGRLGRLARRNHCVVLGQVDRCKDKVEE